MIEEKERQTDKFPRKLGSIPRICVKKSNLGGFLFPLLLPTVDDVFMGC